MNHFYSKLALILLSSSLLFTSGCKKDEGEDVDPGDPNARIYTIAMAAGSGRESQTFVQGKTDLNEGTISYDGYGFEVPSSRTARIFGSEDGKSIYDLDYGGGRIFKFDVLGGENYNQVEQTDVSVQMGTDHPRWTRISETHALMHNVETEREYDENGNFERTVSKATLMLINLNSLTIEEVQRFEIPAGIESESDGDYDHVFRIDAPIVVGNKAYYGLGKAGFDPDNPDSRVSATYENVETMVVDYPSLTNPELISTDIAKGATNGYRTSVSYEDERGDVYQIITVSENTDDTHILKISNGGYDESYSFNLDEKLGENTISNGWFYVGNGIGYVPYTTAGTGDPTWAVARVDLYNGTATKMNLPGNLWLQQYQSGVVIDGKFHMAIAPLGGEGHVYILDPQSDSPDAFTKGAKLQTGADSYYIGIY